MTDQDVTLEGAAAAVRERKRAAGLPPDTHEVRHFAGLDTLAGILVGTDLTAEEVDAYAHGNARNAWPLTLAIGGLGYGSACWTNGLRLGIEYPRQRDAALRRRNSELVGALELARRRLLDLEREARRQPDVIRIPLTDALAGIGAELERALEARP